MPGPYGRPLSHVHHNRYMRYWIDRPIGTETERLMLEHYTGWLACDIGFIGPPTKHFIMKSFLPVGPGEVRFYPEVEPTKPGAIVDWTVVVSPGAMGPAEDEANIFAVDFADVQLEKQTFGGIAGNPQCLILNARLGMLNCHMWQYNYSVQVLTRPESRKVQVIPSDVRPAGGANPEGGPIG